MTDPHNNVLNLRGLASPLLIIGSAHTGKSELAIQALSPTMQAAVIGTAAPHEPAFQTRISELKGLRPRQWVHMEGFDDLNHLLVDLVTQHTPQILVDSINQWLAGVILEGSSHYSLDQLELIANREGETLCQFISGKPDTRIVLVTSEVGAGITPPQPLPRLFRQATSRLNRRLAEACASVVLVTAGIPLVLKGQA